MTLVEDYLRAVALLLPKAQRDDIVAELRDTILSRIETRETELGRALTEDETESVLREVGHPLVVAARYREGPQHVVGPALYPYWIFAVKVAVTIQVVVAVVVFLVQGFGGGDMALAFSRASTAAFTGSATLIGIATVIAWIVERRNIRLGYLDRWKVRDLRALDIFAWDWDWFQARMTAATPRLSTRVGLSRAPKPGALASRALGSIVSGVILLLWWTGALHIPLAANAVELRDLGIDAGAIAIDWAVFQAALSWPVLIYGLALITQGVVILARPSAAALRGLTDIAIGGVELALAVWVWTASALAPAVRVDSVAAFAARTRDVFHHGPPFELGGLLMIGLAVVVLFAVGRVMRGVWEVAVGASRTADGGALSGAH